MCRIAGGVMVFLKKSRSTDATVANRPLSLDSILAEKKVRF